MRTGNRVSWVAALLAVVALAGCSGGRDAPRPPPDTPEHDAAHAIASLPQRPAELRVNGIDPCALFDTSSLNELGITQQPQRRTNGDGVTCLLSQRQLEPTYDLHIAAIPNAGVANWITGSHSRSATMTAIPITIAGFPAVRVYPEAKRDDHCDVVVGVAQGQALRVRFGTSYTGQFPHERACSLSEKAATTAVGALQRKG